jgi:hypothetical protein
VVPLAIDLPDGVTEMESRSPAVTVNGAVAVLSERVAVIVVVPVLKAVTTPWLPATLLITATEVSDELHVADVVMSALISFSYNPNAVNDWVA